MLVAPLVVQFSVLLEPGFTAVGFAANELIVGAPELLCVPPPEPFPDPLPDPDPDPFPPLPLPFVPAVLLVPPQPASTRYPARSSTNGRFFPRAWRRRERRFRELNKAGNRVVAMLPGSVPATIPAAYWS